MTIEKLIEIISEITKVSVAEINENSALIDDLGMDSFEFFKMIYTIEDEIEDTLLNAKLEDVTSVSDIFAMITNRSVD